MVGVADESDVGKKKNVHGMKDEGGGGDVRSCV